MSNQVLTTVPSADDDDISFGAAAAEEEDILIGAPGGEQRLFSPKAGKEDPKSVSTFKPTSPIMGVLNKLISTSIWHGQGANQRVTGLD